MKTLKKLTATLIASFDGAISRIENHDALIQASIQEVQKAGARARVRLQLLKRETAKMEKKVQHHREQSELWKDRAKSEGVKNEQKALECLRRHRTEDQKAIQLEEQLKEQKEVEIQLSHDLSKIEDKVRLLKQQRNILRTRESRAEALRAIQMEEQSGSYDVNDILERWETKVTQYEFESECTSEAVTDFENEYVTREEEESLRRDLHDLISNA